MKHSDEQFNDAVAGMNWEINPPKDLWTGISNRIDAEEKQNVTHIKSYRKSNVQLMPFAIAACLVLALSSILFNFVALQKLNEISAFQTGQIQQSPLAGPALNGPPTLVRVQIAHFLEAERHRLDPEILQEMEKALQTIDKVYSELSLGIEAEPNNSELTALLLEIYSQEAQILETLRASRGESI